MAPPSDRFTLSAFADLLALLASTNCHEEVFSVLLDRLVHLYRAQACAVILIDPRTEYLSIENSYGLSHTFCKGYRRPLATAAVGRLLWTGAPIVIADARMQEELADEVRLEFPFASSLCVQIAVDHRTVGYLHIETADLYPFGEDDVRLLGGFANLAGLALFKSHLSEENLRLDRIDRETGVEKYLPFLERLRVELERARITREHVAVLLLDVDNFKSLSNTYGYDASRALLRALAGAVATIVRPIDALARYGPDEFIVLLAGTTLHDASLVADRICRTIHDAEWTAYGIRTSVSVGLATFPEGGDDLEDLVRQAKNAVFEAQRAGRNSVYWTEHVDGEPERMHPLLS
jgi:diguanylate cyclase (GGDEF)-like protein